MRQGGRLSHMEREDYRVFISYCHRDEPYARILAEYLRQEGLRPLWDKNILEGTGFTEQIQRFISHAHAFLAFITPNANTRGWVQQEIGFARALNIPILPVSVGQLPAGILEQVLATRLDKPGSVALSGSGGLPLDRIPRFIQRTLLSGYCLRRVTTVENLRRLRLGETLRGLVHQSAGAGVLSWKYVQHNRDRVQCLAEYAREVSRLEEYGMVRQKSGLTSFQTPDVGPNDRYFEVRYGDKPRNMDYRHLILGERRELARHAERKGCKLIINPTADYDSYGPESKRVRVEALLAFLRQPPHPETYAVITRDRNPRESLTLVGDWFSATSVSIQLGEGFRQTVFCKHAPSVTAQMREFDEEFHRILAGKGVASEGAEAAEASRRQAAEELAPFADGRAHP